jgi:hypothetical protein
MMARSAESTLLLPSRSPGKEGLGEAKEVSRTIPIRPKARMKARRWGWERWALGLIFLTARAGF